MYKKTNPEPVTYNCSSWELKRFVAPQEGHVSAPRGGGEGAGARRLCGKRSSFRGTRGTVERDVLGFCGGAGCSMRRGMRCATRGGPFCLPSRPAPNCRRRRPPPPHPHASFTRTHSPNPHPTHPLHPPSAPTTAGWSAPPPSPQPPSKNPHPPTHPPPAPRRLLGGARERAARGDRAGGRGGAAGRDGAGLQVGGGGGASGQWDGGVGVGRMEGGDGVEGGRRRVPTNREGGAPARKGQLIDSGRD